MNKTPDTWIAGKHEFQYFNMSSHALLIEWPPAKDRIVLNKINGLITQIQKWKLENILELVPGYHSLTIYYKSGQITSSHLIDKIENLSSLVTPESSDTDIVIIKVNYNTNDGQDLSFVASTLGLTIDEVIDLHSNNVYDVHFIGFLPGFLYLGGLDERLTIPRRETPRLRVPAGSVALAGGQTGIYPIESPGGWHIIGRTEMTLFDPHQSPPCPIQSGMRVRFQPS